MGVLADLFRVPIDYLVEVRQGPVVLSSSTMPSPPTHISYKRDGAVAVEFTMGKTPIRDFGEMRSGRLRISGLAGTYNRSTYGKLGSAGGVVFKGGQESVTAFEQFIEGYHELGAGSGFAVLRAVTGLSAPVLTFRALRENIHVNAEVISFQQSKQVQGTRHFPSWTLDLRIWGIAEASAFTNILSPVSDMFEKAAEAVDTVSDQIAAADNALVNLRGDLESLRAPMKAVLRATDALKAVAGSARSLARFPGDMVADFSAAATALDEVVTSVRGSINILNPVVGSALDVEWERVKKQVFWPARNALYEALLVAGLSGVGVRDTLQAAERLALADGTWSTTLRPTRPPRRRGQEGRATRLVRLGAGEDLRDIAQDVYQDRDRWTEIAEHNGWTSAHLQADGSVALAGSLVVVPLDTEQDAASLGTDDVFKTDLLMDLGKGDLVLNASNTGFLQVQGVPNLVQGLSMRFKTIQGDSDPFPFFGLPDVVGEKNTSSMLGLIGAHSREQALRDPRIRDVRDVELLAEGTKASVSLDVIPVDGAPDVTLIAPLQTR